MTHPLRLGSEQRLILKNRNLARRTQALFQELNGNEQLQQTFIESPAEVIGHELLHQTYSPEQALAVNQFIYSVLASEGLQSWSAEYDATHAGQQISPDQRLRDLAEAFVIHGDAAVMKGLLQLAESGVNLSGLTQDALIVKAESVAVGNWFVVKVSGMSIGDEELVLPAAQVQRLAQQLLQRAKELQRDGQL